jgi:nucleoside-diphosphate-sugar epimerase
MTADAKGRVTLVAGAGGIIGHTVTHELKRQGWGVQALARRLIDGAESIGADLTDAQATAATLKIAADTTHLFYAALSPDSDVPAAAQLGGSRHRGSAPSPEFQPQRPSRNYYRAELLWPVLPDLAI